MGPAGAPLPGQPKPRARREARNFLFLPCRAAWLSVHGSAGALPAAPSQGAALYHTVLTQALLTGAAHRSAGDAGGVASHHGLSPPQGSQR